MWYKHIIYIYTYVCMCVCVWHWMHMEWFPQILWTCWACCISNSHQWKWRPWRMTNDRPRSCSILCPQRDAGFYLMPWIACGFTKLCEGSPKIGFKISMVKSYHASLSASCWSQCSDLVPMSKKCPGVPSWGLCPRVKGEKLSKARCNCSVPREWRLKLRWFPVSLTTVTGIIMDNSSISIANETRRRHPYHGISWRVAVEDVLWRLSAANSETCLSSCGETFKIPPDPSRSLVTSNPSPNVGQTSTTVYE